MQNTRLHNCNETSTTGLIMHEHPPPNRDVSGLFPYTPAYKLGVKGMLMTRPIPYSSSKQLIVHDLSRL